MAENKKAIVVYADWMEKFEALDDNEAGRLIKHFFRYVNDLHPTAPDRITELAFIDIKQSLRRDLKKWEERAKRSRENGKNGGRPKREETQETQQDNSEPRKPDSVNVNDSVNVTDNVVDVIKSTTSVIISSQAKKHLNLSNDEFALYACRQTKKSVDDLKALVDEFIKDQSAIAKTWQGVPDIRKHFINWVKKQNQIIGNLPQSSGYTIPKRRTQ